MSKIVKVVCSIIVKGNIILVTQRSEKMAQPLKWEFPGGKIKPYETEKDCIKREIKEELNIEIEPVMRLTPSVFIYSNFTIELIPYISDYLSGEIKLAEHKQYLWLSKEDLLVLDWAEADLPIVKEYMEL